MSGTIHHPILSTFEVSIKIVNLQNLHSWIFVRFIRCYCSYYVTIGLLWIAVCSYFVFYWPVTSLAIRQFAFTFYFLVSFFSLFVSFQINAKIDQVKKKKYVLVKRSFYSLANQNLLFHRLRFSTFFYIVIAMKTFCILNVISLKLPTLLIHPPWWEAVFKHADTV